jgi:hypothetical protein
MKWSFEIMHVRRHHNGGNFIFARLIDGLADFELKEGSKLGGIPIYNYVDMPRTLDENGNLRLDIFVFKPISLEWLPENYFVEGQRVNLVLPDGLTKSD